MPELPFGFKDLEPYISEGQLKIHYEKHHRAYVEAANAGLEKLANARKEGMDIDIKALMKDLSFNIGGYLLHTLFWGNLAPAGKCGGEPSGALARAIKKEFGGFERFKKEFSQAARSVEGSGWAALVYSRELNRPMITQIEKHNANVFPAHAILMVLDVFEHAYYIDYKNDRAKFIEAFWSIVNWEEAERRFEAALK